MSSEELFDSLFTPLGNPFYNDFNLPDLFYTSTFPSFLPSYTSESTTTVIKDGIKIETCIKNHNGAQIKTTTTTDLANNLVLNQKIDQFR